MAIFNNNIPNKNRYNDILLYYCDRYDIRETTLYVNPKEYTINDNKNLILSFYADVLDVYDEDWEDFVYGVAYDYVVFTFNETDDKGRLILYAGKAVLCETRVELRKPFPELLREKEIEIIIKPLTDFELNVIRYFLGYFGFSEWKYTVHKTTDSNKTRMKIGPTFPEKQINTWPPELREGDYTNIRIALSAEKSILDNLFSKMQSNESNSNDPLWPEQLLFGLVDEDIAQQTSGPICCCIRESDHIYINIDTYCTGISLAAWEYLSDTIPGLKLNYLVSSWKTGLFYSTDPTGYYFGEKKYKVDLILLRTEQQRFKTKTIKSEGATIEELIRNINTSYGTSFSDFEDLIKFFKKYCYNNYDSNDPFPKKYFFCWKNPNGDDEITEKYFHKWGKWGYEI